MHYALFLIAHILHPVGRIIKLIWFLIRSPGIAKYTFLPGGVSMHYMRLRRAYIYIIGDALNQYFSLLFLSPNLNVISAFLFILKHSHFYIKLFIHIHPSYLAHPVYTDVCNETLLSPSYSPCQCTHFNYCYILRYLCYYRGHMQMCLQDLTKSSRAFVIPLQSSRKCVYA